MKKRNWLKTTIAMITLIATVLETGFSSVSTLAAEITTEDGIVVNNDAIGETETNSDNSQSEDLDVTVEPDGDYEPEEASVDAYYSDDASEPSYSDEEEGIGEEPAAEETHEDAATSDEASLDVSGSEISGSGYDEVAVVVNTDALDKKDKFRIAFSGPGSASYNPVLNEELDRTNGGKYFFEDLEGGYFSVRATSSDDVNVSYKYNEDGDPTIVLESIPAEKILNTTVLTTSDDERISAISGSGYDSIKVEFNTEDLSDRTKFKFYVDSDAAATVDGESVSGGIRGLSKDASALTVEELDEEEFTVYVIADGEFNIEAVPEVISTDDGIAAFDVNDVATKRIYEYEDSKVYVRATLEKADAVPDDADFVVTELLPESTKYNYETYMNALNENADAIVEDADDVEFNEDNTLLYDIGFFVDVDGSKVEFEPAEGTVSFVIQFKDGQLAEKQDDSAIGVAHLSLSDAIKDSVDTTADATDITTNDVKVENVDDSFASTSEEILEFDLDSLSVIAIYEVDNKDDNKLELQGGPGDPVSANTLLGDAWYYGITANTFKMTGGGDGETNFAAKSVVNQDGWGQTGLTDKAGESKHAKYIIGDYSGNKDLKFKDKMNRTIEVPVGNNFENRFSKENANTVTTYTRVASDTITSTINNMVEYAAQKSADLASGNSVTSNVTDSDLANLNGKKVTVDISEFGAGTFYINADQITPIRDALEQTGQLKIVKNDNQKIVFNFFGDEVYLCKYDINDTNSDDMNDYPDTSLEGSEIDDIIFNMPNATKVYIDIQAGIFLAPKATATITGSCGGWIVADTVDAKCEWHFTNGRIPQPPIGQGELYIPVQKYFYNGQGHWGEGFKFKLEKIDFGWNWSREIKDKSFEDQVITINGGDNEVASGTFDPIVYYSTDSRFSAIGWDINNKKPEGYDDVFEEWYKITEIPPADALPGTVSNIYGTDEYGTDYPCWYLHVYVYRDRETGYVLTAMRTARKDPVEYYKHYSKIPCEEARQIIFYNQYIPVELNGIKKVVLGTEEQSVPAGKFTFNLYEWIGTQSKWSTTPMQTVTNGGENGTEISFAPFALPAEGTRVQGNNNAYDYYYLIKEADCEKPYIKDNGVYVVKIRREKEWYSIGGQRKLYRFNDTIKYFHFDSQDKISGVLNDTAAFSMSPFVFTNKIDIPKPVNTKIYGAKELKNRKLSDREFTFILENSTGDKADPKFDQFTNTRQQNVGGKFNFTTRNYTVEDLGANDQVQFEYILREFVPSDNDKIPGVTYDDIPRTITVTLSKNTDGSLRAVASPGAVCTNPVKFTNTYSTKVEFRAKKTYGNKLAAKGNRTFYFDLYEYSDAAFKNAIEGSKKTVDINGQNIGSFGQIDYKEEGNHYYTIREQVPSDASAIDGRPGFYKKGGIIYDGRYYRIKVEVKKENGTITPKLFGGYEGEELKTLGNGVLVATPEFTNDYDMAPTELLLDGHKYLTGSQAVGNYRFKFELKPYGTFTTGKVASGSVKMPKDDYLTAVNDTDGYFAFGKADDHENGYIKFTEATGANEEYVFAITENKAGTEAVDPENNKYISKIDHSKFIYLVKVTVDDNGSGQLVPTKKVYRYTKNDSGEPVLTSESEITTGNIDFTNVLYGDTNIPVKALKRLVRLDGNNEVTVAINQNKPFKFILKDTDNNTTTEASCGTDGIAVFNELSYGFGDEGEHHYTVTEWHPDGAKLEGGYYVKEGDPYKYSSESYSFTVNVTSDPATGAITATPDKNTTADFAFKNIYTAKGEYPIYGIKEITGKDYDDEDPFTAELYQIVGEEEKLIDSVEIKSSGSWSDKIKAFFGTEYLKGAYEFNTTEANKVEELCFDAGDIGKRFNYIVRETGSNDDVVNDSNPERRITLKVTDNGDGTLNIDDTGSELSGGVVYFTNHHIDPTGITFSARKEMVDKNGTVITPFDKKLKGKFEFVLEEKNGQEWKKIKSDTINENGTVSFDTIDYKKEDLENPNREYRIRESHPDGATLVGEYWVKDGDPYKYSNESYQISVVLTEEANGTNGTIVKATPAYSKTAYNKITGQFETTALAGSEVFTVTFKNNYEPKGDEVTLKAKKKFEGGNIAAGQFGFTLYNPDGTVAKDGDTVLKTTAVAATANDGVAQSEAVFPTMHYTLDDLTEKAVDEDGNQAYIKRYYMMEDHPENATFDGKNWYFEGMVYDGGKYNVEVYLYDKDGEIEAHWIAFKDGDAKPDLSTWDKVVAFFTGNNPLQNAEFINKYNAKASFEFNAHKVMTGGRKLDDFDDGFFKFEIYDKSGKNLIAFANEKEGRNPSPVSKGSGYSQAWHFEYDKVDTYEYVVKEVMPEAATKDNDYTVDGVKYDPNSHKVTVTVTDNTKGSFDVAVTVDGAAVTVATEDVANEKTKTTMKSYKLVDAVGTPEFTNNYDVVPVQIRFDGTKTLTGGPELKAGDFTFVLQRRTVENGVEKWEKVEDTTNAANGNFIFKPLKYTGNSMLNASGTYDTEKTFTYRVRELDADGNEVTGTFKVNGITYTGKVVEINVKVKDIGGKLQATIIDTAAPNTPLAVQEGLTNDTINVGEFVNEYEADGEVSFPVTKIIEGIVEDEDKTFEFKLEGIGNDVDGSKITNTSETISIVVPKGTKAATKNFSTIKFDRTNIKEQANGEVSGTYSFKVSEIVPGSAGSSLNADEYKGYTFSKELYEVTVKVTDNGDGTLNCAKTYEKVADFEGNGYAGEAAAYSKETLEFTNKYTAEGQFEFSGLKDMTNKPIKDGDFVFVLKDAEGNEIDRTTTASEGGVTALTLGKDNIYRAQAHFAFPSETAKSAADPYFKVDLDDLKDKGSDGVAHKLYTVTETYKTKKGGVTYSSAVYNIDVRLKDNKDGTIDTKVYVIGEDGTETLIYGTDEKGKQISLKDVVKFENTYESKCKIDPPVLTKQMVGKEIEYGEFEFKITGPGLKSMGEDETGYERVVKNGYDKNGNKLPENKKGEICVSDIVYQFTDLIDENDEAALKNYLATGKAERTFTYYAEEIVKKDGIDYALEGLDHTPQKLKLVVTIKDDDNGGLHVYNGKGEEVTDWDNPNTPKLKWEALSEYTLDDEQMNDVFLNRYNQETSIDIVGVKILDGRELTKDDKFKFTITDDPKRYKAGETPQSVTVDNTNDALSTPSVVAFRGKNSPEDKAKGCVDVDFLNYRWGAFETAPGSGQLVTVDDRTKDGEFYVYTVVEENYNENGIISDKAEFKIYVKVFTDTTTTDKNGHHPLKADIDHIDRNSVRYVDKTFRFNNQFSAKGSVSINGIKLLTDELDKAKAVPNADLKQFKFMLYQYDDAARTKNRTPVFAAPVYADEYGRFKFDLPEYTEKLLKNDTDPNKEYDDEKTLYYQVVEIPPTEGQWTENNTVFASGKFIYDLKKVDIDVTVKLTFDESGRVTDKLDVVKKAADGTVLGSADEDIKYVAFTNKERTPKTISGTKTWIDKETDASRRPDVTIDLYSSAVDGGRTPINSYTIKAPALEYTFTSDRSGKPLYEFDESGKTITYEVRERDVAGYFSEKNGFNFINTSGDVVISKIDADTGSPLAGATLAVFDGSTEIERWVTGASAHVLDAAVKVGRTYTLREISAPEGYEIAPDQTFSIPEDGSDITVTMSDKRIIGSVRLTKRDSATREALAGAEFALYTDAGVRIYATGSVGSYRVVSTTSNGVFVTDATGSLTVADLPYGTYYFVETKAPDGYELSTERLGFTVLRTGELVEVTYLNTKAVGSVRLRKVDTTRTFGLAGAVFELYARTPRTVGQAASSTLFSDAYYRYGTYRTNAAGEIYVGDLPWDDYYFVEVDAPDGYEVATDVNGDDLVYVFTVGAGTADLTIDLGGIVNNPTEETPPPRGGVLGARVKKGGVVNGVLGVRAKPTSGVLGERIGPVTGDASNIILWLLLLTACVATIVVTIITGKKKKTVK